MQVKKNSFFATFCPYYINIDRLVDISASLSYGYSEYEDIEISTVTSQGKSKSLSANHKNKFFSLGLDVGASSAADSTESKKIKRIHTQASLLNNTINILHKKAIKCFE